MKRLMMLSTLMVFAISIGCSEDTGTEPDSRQQNSLSTLKKKDPPPNLLQAGNVSSGVSGVSEDRHFYAMGDRDGGSPVVVWSALVPGTSRVIATWSGTSASIQGYVLLENGDVYWAFSTMPTWILAGNLLSASTPAEQVPGD